MPGLIFDTPDVGGNQAGLQRGFTARGTPNTQNVQLLNGANVGDPAAIGFSMNYYDPTSFQNIQVTTGAQDISLGTSGVSINMVTKSGTNSLRRLVPRRPTRASKTQWDNIDEELKDGGIPAGRERDGAPDQHQRQRRRPARPEQAVLFRVDELPADAHQRAGIPGRVAAAGAARRHQHAGHDGHPDRHGPADVRS